MIQIYDELEEKYENEFDDLFDNEYQNKRYIVHGTIGAWYGKRENAYFPEAFNSLKKAIIESNNGFNGYISIYEDENGKMILMIYHHDGRNTLEIKELTELGEEKYNNYEDIGEIIKQKNTTKNVEYTKNFW